MATTSNLNPANAITASRFLCLPLFFWAMGNHDQQAATLIVLICGLLDKVDGLAARIFDCRTQFGEVFDGIADGIDIRITGTHEFIDANSTAWSDFQTGGNSQGIFGANADAEYHELSSQSSSRLQSYV